MQDVFEDVRDFIILHFKVTRRKDSEFWNYCRKMDVPDKLAAKLDLWRSKGRIFREGVELFGTASWVAVLLGQGLIPETPEPAAYAADEAFVADFLERMRLSYRHTAERMPTHAEFIARTCAAEPVMPA
jgi:tryptophan halogenase